MWRWLVIFNDKFTGDEEGFLYKESRFKAFSLPDSDANYTTRSLGLIYEKYCRWLKTRHGFYQVELHMEIPDKSNICSESALDYWFNDIQMSLRPRATCSDNSIGFVWKTYRDNDKVIHKGHLLISMTKKEYCDIPRGKKATIPKGVRDILSNSMKVLSVRFEGKLNHCFSFSIKGEGEETIFHDSDFKAHEQSFQALCQVAQLPKQIKGDDFPLFRVRYGYHPGYDMADDFEQSIITRKQWTKPFQESNWVGY
tara:strand:+ start:15286 stop:16047 length:762 start_codon:yes stop_codon:yes gene_type:complete